MVRAFGLRITLRRAPRFYDVASVHEHNTVCYFSCKTGSRVCVIDDHSHAIGCQFFHNIQNFSLPSPECSAEVGSSNSMISGLIASALAIATRCFCPPRAYSDKHLPCQTCQHALTAEVLFPLPALLSFFQFYRSQHDIFQNRHVRKQVKTLNTIPDVLTHFVDALVCLSVILFHPQWSRLRSVPADSGIEEEGRFYRPLSTLWIPARMTSAI